MKRYLIFAIVLFTTCFVKAQQASDITVTIENIENNGSLNIGLYNSKASFYKETSDFFLGKKIKVSSGKLVKAVFENIPHGTYAIKLFLDEDGDDKMDKLFGIPTEQYGFSNNPDSSFGPPDYEECTFIVNKETALTIKLK